MVPLERVLRKPGGDAVAGFALPELRPRSPEEQAPEEPRVFKVVDIMTRQMIAGDLDVRGAVKALEDVRSIVDINVYVWQADTDRWRMLTFGETQALWGYRGRVDAEPMG
jgi:hypothetical protein